MAEGYNFVNWVDGMKLSRAHFLQEENAFIKKLNQTAATLTTSFHYGLLPPRGGDKHLDMSLEVDRAKLLRVQIRQCHAVTPGGVVININEERPFSNQSEINGLSSEVSLDDLSNGRSYYVALSVNPFGKTAIGEPNPDENPPRYPDSDYSYEINLVPADGSDVFENGLYHVSIGKFSVVPNGIEIDETYVPPCTSCLSHPDLIDVSRDLSSVLNTMEAKCVSIIQDIYDKEQDNELAQTVLYMLERLLPFYSNQIHYFRWQVPEQSPIYLVQVIAAMARTTKNAVDAKGKSGKELMLNYFKNWISEMSQGEFEEIVEAMVNIEYKHTDINDSLEKILVFCNMLTNVLKKLDELEFIGDQKVKKGPAVKMQRKEEVDMEAKKPTKRSFLAG